jgi:hypothetical protein
MTLELILMIAVPLLSAFFAERTGPFAKLWKFLVPRSGPLKLPAPAIVPDDPNSIVDDLLRLLLQLDKILPGLTQPGVPAPAPPAADNPRLPLLDLMLQRIRDRLQVPFPPEHA